MVIRKPRGYTVNRPAYVELCEGVRPNVQALPLEAWTGLPPVRIDDHANDPIVIDAGTVVGISTGTYDGKLFPCVLPVGATGAGGTSCTFHFESADSTWGLPTSDQTVDPGVVKPIGVVFQPIYSFYLPLAFTNYTRTVNVGIVTDYVIQIPALTTAEHLIRAGDLVQVADNHLAYGRLAASAATVTTLAGRYRKWDQTAATTEFVVGRCLKSFVYADSGSGAPTTFQNDTAATVTAAALAEFAGLNQVETVPGMSLSGSGTGGVPGHLLGGVPDGSGNFRALTILVRL